MFGAIMMQYITMTGRPGVGHLELKFKISAIDLLDPGILDKVARKCICVLSG